MCVRVSLFPLGQCCLGLPIDFLKVRNGRVSIKVFFVFFSFFFGVADKLISQFSMVVNFKLPFFNGFVIDLGVVVRLVGKSL